ncbi:MAG TPA: hypothetical protein VFU24_10685 [Burkholderiales bacterium]|nr:hypothetical protein [Burkholderiales bacterium]
MKRLCHRVILGLAATILGVPCALAAPNFGNEDLKGDYLFVVVEVHSVTLPGGLVRPEHCVIAGTANFDGAGKMTMSATQRCNLTGSGAVEGSQFYSVNPDGSFLISESAGMTDPVHGQLADHGRTLLLDGTLRTLPEIISWSGIAMKR